MTTCHTWSRRPAIRQYTPVGHEYLVPLRQVADLLDVQITRYLGGRANKHWLVTSGTRPFVLRAYQRRPIGDIGYELRVLHRLDAMGWPTPVAVTDPVQAGDRTWCLFRWLPGTSTVVTDEQAADRERGRLLARLHHDLAALADLEQRPGCRPAEQIVADPELIDGLRDYERLFPHEARVMRWHADRARECFDHLNLRASPLMVIHGDFVNHNLLFVAESLSGILDFEGTHLNHRASEFALAWRGRHDAVIHGYEEIRPLDELDRALLAPTLWSWVFLGVADDIRRMTDGELTPHRFEWQTRILLRRSPLMGEHGTPYRDPLF